MFFSVSVFSQSINLHINPFTALDLAPRWRIGVEYDTQMDVAFSLDIGYGNDALQVKAINRRRWDNEYSYLEFRPEIKLFLTSFKRNPNFRKIQQQKFKKLGIRQESNSAAYISLEYFHSRLQNTFYDLGVNLSSNAGVSFDKGTFHKIKNGGHFKLGVKHRFGHFILDFSGGIGGTHRNKFYTNTKNIQTSPPFYDDREWGFTDSYKEVGVKSLLHGTLNLRVGYMIWRKEN